MPARQQVSRRRPADDVHGKNQAKILNALARALHFAHLSASNFGRLILMLTFRGVAHARFISAEPH